MENLRLGRLRPGNLHPHRPSGNVPSMPDQTRILAATLLCFLANCSSTPKNTGSVYRGLRAVIMNGEAYAPRGVPRAVERAVAAANEISHLPYQFGGGHGRRCYGLDCS